MMKDIIKVALISFIIINLVLISSAYAVILLTHILKPSSGWGLGIIIFAWIWMFGAPLFLALGIFLSNKAIKKYAIIKRPIFTQVVVLILSYCASSVVHSVLNINTFFYLALYTILYLTFFVLFTRSTIQFTYQAS